MPDKKLSGIFFIQIIMLILVNIIGTMFAILNSTNLNLESYEKNHLFWTCNVLV